MAKQKRKPQTVTLEDWVLRGRVSRTYKFETGVLVPQGSVVVAAERAIAHDEVPENPDGTMFFTKSDCSNVEVHGLQKYTCPCGETLVRAEVLLMEGGRAMIVVNCNECDTWHVIETRWKPSDGC